MQLKLLYFILQRANNVNDNDNDNNTRSLNSPEIALINEIQTLLLSISNGMFFYKNF